VIVWEATKAVEQPSQASLSIVHKFKEENDLLVDSPFFVAGVFLGLLLFL